MGSKKYRVVDGIYGAVLADNMEFEMALVFIRGYKDAFYNELLDIKIEETKEEEQE